MDLEPIPDHPALLAGDVLVVADLHIGLEEELEERGVRIPSQADVMGQRIAELGQARGAERLIILGDVKHLVPKTVPRERRDVYLFFRDLVEIFREIQVAQGNHDGLLKNIVPRAVRFRPPYGFRLDDIGFCHGHAWPYKKVMETKTLVMGHNHPAVGFRDTMGQRQVHPCWLRAPFVRGHRRYPRLPKDVIVVPSFNELCGGTPLNDVQAKFLGPLFREGLIAVDEAEVHLLDGTALGRLKDLRTDLGFPAEDYRQ